MDKKKSEQQLKKAGDLMKQAYSYLDEYEIAKARKIGKELVAIRYSGGYEILSLCFQQENKAGKAIEILKEGCARMPEAWPLWQQLGNAYSDMDEFEQAHGSYKRALACPGADQATINFEIALAFYRQGRSLESLAILENLPEDWLSRSSPLRASVLNALQRWDETIELCRRSTEQALSRLQQTELSRQDICSLFTELALALNATEKNEEAIEIIKTAANWGTNPFTLRKLRELRNRSSEQAKHYSLTVKGKWHEAIAEEDYVPEFFRTFQIIADSPEEALSFARELEPGTVADSLTIDEFDELEQQANSLKGVYEVTGHIFFKDE